MIIIAWKKISSYCKLHPTSCESLLRWYKLVGVADWSTAHQMFADIGYVDSVGNDRYVFNIKGNDYRLVAMIHFDRRTVYVRFIGTHIAYNKIDCSTI
jgi:mRNA interferase HigB